MQNCYLFFYEPQHLTFIEDPKPFNKNRKIKTKIQKNESLPAASPKQQRVFWDGEKYIITPGANTEVIVPFPMAGRLVYQGKEFFEEFTIRNGDSLEYYPLTETGNFGWDLKVSEDGSRAIAEVQNERPGTFSLKNNIVWRRKWFLEHNIIWKELEWCVDLVKAGIFQAELQTRGIKYGIVPDFWNKILAVQGSAEVLIAEQTPPIPPINAHIIDFEDGLESKQQITDIVDYYASKIITCEKDDVIARKIPGREGRPGRDMFGNELPVYEMVDLQLKAGPNTYLSADGLEVRAKFHGTPIKLNKYTYSVEEIISLA